MIKYAHSPQNGKPAQRYEEHARGVMSGTRRNVEAFEKFVSKEKLNGYLAAAVTAAEYHDLGKLNRENQAVLSGEKQSKKLPVEHRDAGLLHLMSKGQIISAALVFAHHHPGLPNLNDQYVSANPFRFSQTMSDSEAKIQEYLEQHRELVNSGEVLSEANLPQRLAAMEYRMLLSCLVDADYSDSAGEPPHVSKTQWAKRLEQLDRYVQEISRTSKSAGTDRDQLRQEFYQFCKDAPAGAPVEFCDSPVGTGKTTAVMAHMLNVAEKDGLRHIFVIVPLVNIISQTVAVLRKALVLEGENPEEVVAELHHQADFENIQLRRLAAAWNAPVIVTTAVQFFETLAGDTPSKLRKLHQLPGSAVIVDEYHAALPQYLYPPAWKWITELVKQWGCRFCLCSGTALRFWQTPEVARQAKGEAVALLSGELAGRLHEFEWERINLKKCFENIRHFVGEHELINYIQSFGGSKIVVLDTILSAAVLAGRMREKGHDVLHLSTALTAEDKEAVITEVKRRLEPENQYTGTWTLVATSCVECGLDVSFRHGFCQLRSLQSFLQISGRINRNREYEDSTMTIFTAAVNGFAPNPAFDIPRSIFQKQIESGKLLSCSITDAVTKNFEMELKERGTGSNNICRMDQLCAFKEVAENFKVIDDDAVTVVVKPELVRKRRAGEWVSAHEIQRGSVRIRRSILAKLDIEDGELPLLKEGQYDSFLGYMKSLVH